MQNTYVIILLILLGFVLGAVAVGIFTNNGVLAPEKPSEGMPFLGSAPSDVAVDEERGCGIFVTSPLQNEAVESPISVTGFIANVGSAPCWPAFEAIAGTVRLFDANSVPATNRIPVTLIGNWMTTGQVNFEVTLSYPDTPQDVPGYLLFENTYGEDEVQILTHQVSIKF